MGLVAQSNSFARHRHQHHHSLDSIYLPDAANALSKISILRNIIKMMHSRAVVNPG